MLLVCLGPGQTLKSVQPSSCLVHRLLDPRTLPSNRSVDGAGVGETEPAGQLVVDLTTVARQPLIAQQTILGGSPDR